MANQLSTVTIRISPDAAEKVRIVKDALRQTQAEGERKANFAAAVAAACDAWIEANASRQGGTE